MSVFYTVFGVGVVVGGRQVCLFFTQYLELVWWWVVDGCVCFLHSVWCWCGGGW